MILGSCRNLGCIMGGAPSLLCLGAIGAAQCDIFRAAVSMGATIMSGGQAKTRWAGPRQPSMMYGRKMKGLEPGAGGTLTRDLRGWKCRRRRRLVGKHMGLPIMSLGPPATLHVGGRLGEGARGPLLTRSWIGGHRERGGGKAKTWLRNGMRGRRRWRWPCVPSQVSNEAFAALVASQEPFTERYLSQKRGSFLGGAGIGYRPVLSQAKWERKGRRGKEGWLVVGADLGEKRRWRSASLANADGPAASMPGRGRKWSRRAARGLRRKGGGCGCGCGDSGLEWGSRGRGLVHVREAG